MDIEDLLTVDEVDRLKEKNKFIWKTDKEKYQEAEDTIRKKAVKEFAEKLKEKALSHCRIINCYELTFIETTINELLREYER